jgi:hypothetical protein
MKERSVPGDEMPRLPFLTTHREPASPQLPELLGTAPSGAMDDGWQHVSELLQAAAAPATASELAGEAAMFVAFRQAHHSAPARRRLLKRPRMLTTLLTGKLAAVLAAATVGATGVATAAYANVLPDGMQNFAHHLIAAPPAHSHASATGRDHGHQFGAPTSASPSPSASESATPSPSTSTSDSPSPSVSDSASATTSPSASPSVNSAAFGLCTAWSNAVSHGSQDKVGFRTKLAGIAAAANTTGTAGTTSAPVASGAPIDDNAITAFCATVQHPGSNSDDPADGSASASTSPEAQHPGKSGGNNGQGNSNGKSHGNPHDGNDASASVSPSPTPTS